MLSYPTKIDARIAQAVAILTFVTNFTILLRPDLGWVIFPLTGDFILRYIHPKLSPSVRIFKFLSHRLQLKEKFYYAPPKRFATLLGVFFTLGISLTTILGLIVIQKVLIGGLLIASFLQGFLDYCIGCEIYEWMRRIGVVDDSQVFTTKQQA